MSKAFRKWKAARLGVPPLQAGPLPKRLFTQRNYRMVKRQLQKHEKWKRKTINNVMSDVERQIELAKMLRGEI
jgi:hypothetical protein